MLLRSSLGLLAAACCVASAEPWRAIGPGGGGAQYRPVLSPLDPGLVVARTDMNAGFVSEDAGERWRSFHLGAMPRAVLFDGGSSSIVYALMPGRLGFYESRDRGRLWDLVYPPAAAVDRIVYQDDEAEPYVLYRAGAVDWPPLRAAAADPELSGMLYGVRAGRLEQSGDGGRTWRALAQLGAGWEPLAGTSENIFVDPRSPKRSRAVWVARSASILFWNGHRWRTAAPPGRHRIVEATAGFDARRGRLYVLTDAPALWATSAEGAEWERLDGALAELTWRGTLPRQLRAPAAAPGNPDRLYLSFSGLRGWFSTLAGVARSDDGGHTWRTVWADGRRPALNVADAWVTRTLGPAWGENPLGIGVSPKNPDLVFTSDLGRTMRTRDGGEHWEAVYSRADPDHAGAWRSTGLDVTTSYGVHFDPFNARRMYITYTDIGLFRSENAGESWAPSSTGIPRDWANSVYWMAFDPDVADRQWIATGGVHDLPRMKMVRRWRPERSDWHGGVCESRDGGRTWTPASQGLPGLPVTHLLLDRRSTPAARVLYAAVFGGGIYKSSDGGQSWQAASEGIGSGARPLVWRLAQDAGGVLYAIVARRNESLSFGDSATDGAVYRSRDAARTWERLALPPGLNGPTGLAIDPRDPQRLALSSFGRFAHASLKAPVQGGIHVSSDGGRTWRATFGADQYLYDVTLDPARPGTLFATGFQSSLWRSDDRGEHWRRLPGFNVKNAHRVIADPLRPGMIYVTTYGSSVWHGPDSPGL